MKQAYYLSEKLDALISAAQQERDDQEREARYLAQIEEVEQHAERAEVDAKRTRKISYIEAVGIAVGSPGFSSAWSWRK